MGDEKVFKMSKRDAEFHIKGIITRARIKIILIIVGSSLISYVVRDGMDGHGVSWLASNILWIIGCASFFLAFFWTFVIFTDHRNASRSALEDWETFVEDEEKLLEKHRMVTDLG